MTTDQLSGGCHCQRISVLWRTARPLALHQPRACDCSFCLKHRAAWLSDPASALLLHARDRDSLGRYRQGSESAEFLLCRHCGVLLAVLFEDNGSCFAAVNARCLDSASLFAPDQIVSPQQLAPEQRRARWRQLWIPEVRLEWGRHD